VPDAKPLQIAGTASWTRRSRSGPRKVIGEAVQLGRLIFRVERDHHGEP
jgi:hypothetical protein